MPYVSTLSVLPPLPSRLRSSSDCAYAGACAAASNARVPSSFFIDKIPLFEIYRLIVRQRKGPDRAADRHVLQRFAAARAVESAQSRQYRHVLPAFVRPRNRHGVDAGTRAELPQLLAGIRVEREKLAGVLAAEKQAASGRQHRRGNLEIAHRDAPFRRGGQWVDRFDVADDVARLNRRIGVFDADVTHAGLEPREFLQAHRRVTVA